MIRNPVWLTALVLSAAFLGDARAQNAPFRAQLGPPIVQAQPEGKLLPPVLPPTLPTTPPIPVTPPISDRVFAIPSFFGDFYAGGVGRRVDTFSTKTLTYTASASEPSPKGGGVFGFTVGAITGPGGPFVISSEITGKVGTPPNANLNENTELTALVRAKFAGVAFLNGTGNTTTGSVLLNYLQTIGTPNAFVFALLPNPSGGGLVGRNNYFENGSPVPHDRIYFFYNHIGAYQGLGTPIDINRYVFGFEKTFLGGTASIELRLPFAGTLNSIQQLNQGLSVNSPEFGNIGVVLRGVLLRTPDLLVSAGLGFSLPTANDSQMQLNGVTVLDIQNRTVLLQPIFGVAWAPTDRLYGQFGAQLDFDPSGNPVRFLQTDGSMTQAGTLHDRYYSFVSSSLGYWAYRNPGGTLSGLAFQTELLYTTAFGAEGIVNDGNVFVASSTTQTSVLNATAGIIATFGDRTYLSLGVSFPVAGERLYDWSVTAQLNARFGPRR